MDPNLLFLLCLAVIMLNLLAWYKLNQKVNQLRRPIANRRQSRPTKQSHGWGRG